MTEKTESLGGEIIKLLGLPSNGQKMEILFAGNAPVKIKYEYILEPCGKNDEIIRKLQEYELMPKP